VPGFAHFLRCIGKAAVKHGVRALVDLAPMGGALYDIASDAWTDYRDENKHAELRAELQALAQASPAEARQAAEQVTREVAAGQPPEVQIALTSYLSQVPAAVRQSLRRPADPTGTSVPGTMALNKPEALLPFLPTRLPRFKPGDCPPGVGDWELVELLGTGGFGEVWKARHATLTSRKPVALKFCLDAATAGALRNEAQLLDRVMHQGRHPGIVPLLQTYLRADPPCLEYELVEGGDLAGFIQEQMTRGGVSTQFAAQIIHRLAKTVAFAHGLNPPIVHRDLKPANILVQRKPDGKVALLVADFGIGGIAAAQVIRKETGQQKSREQSLPSAVRGACTPLYASPQQRRGDRPDPRDDIHALGVMWHQFLAGDLTAERPGGRGWRKKRESRGMAPGLLDLLESCIDDDPNERPANAEDLAARMEPLLEPVRRTYGPAPRQSRDLRGKLLKNRYRIEKLLAMGGFGAVYLAADTEAGNRPVAIKDMICPDPREFDIRLNMFRREAEILRSLESLPIVPRFYGLIEHEGAAQLVMEYIRGDDLLKIMEVNNNKPFPIDQLIEWGKSVCDLFAFMHMRTPPLLYRDMGPGNLMLPENGQGIRVVGFSCAHAMGHGQATGLNQMFRKCYSEGFAPPEQIIGKPEPRSDLFALAGTLYYMLTGRSPEGFYTARELETQLTHGEGPWPAEHRWLYELIKIDLSEDVCDRSRSAREFKADLEQRHVTKALR